jgi:glycogen operon protein
MNEDDWHNASVQTLGMFLSGHGLNENDERGRTVKDENFLLLLNGHHEDVRFTLPLFHPSGRWVAWMDTARENGLHSVGTHEGGTEYALQARSFVVLMERYRNDKTEESNEAAS